MMKKIMQSLFLVFVLNIIKIDNALSLDDGNIDHAGVCGPTSTYKDSSTIEKAIGNSNYLDKALGNSKYCPVYCVEENVFTFPGFKPEVPSGSHFTWTIGETNKQNIIDGLTVKLHGTRNCRTKIDLNKWNEDYNDLIKKIEDEIDKLTAKASKQTFCNSNITGSGGGNSGGWHYMDTGRYVSDNYNRPFETHTTGSGSTTNYYRYDFQIDTSNPIAGYKNDGTPMYNMIWKKFEAAPDICKESGGQSLKTGWFDSSSAAKSALESMADAKCGGSFDDDYGDYSIKLTNCQQSSRVSGRHLECHTEVQTGVCIDLDSNGDCIYGNSSSKICNWVDDYEYQYSGSTIIRRCSYAGTHVTKSDVKTPCRETGLYTCPSGYYVYSSTTCYKTDTSYLKKLLKQQQDMIDILKECSTITFDYELDTSMSVHYEEPVYSRIEKLEVKETLSTIKENHKVSAGNKQVKYYVCDLDVAEKKCWLDKEKGEISYIWISEYGKQYDVEYEYTLPKEMYQYVLLPIGKSVDVVPSNYGNQLSGFQNYLDIGYSNYPVHYTTPFGTYNLDILYKNVGYKDHFTSIIRNYKPSVIDTSGNVIYDCEYDVNNGEPFCPEGGCDPTCIGADCHSGDKDNNGVKLIYRPISLSIPFPGTDGSGRAAGANWNNTLLINRYILNNRNTTGDTIYSQREPMYEIVLNPSRIKEIRQYNSKTTYDDFNLKCVKGYECKSEFIRESSVGFASYFRGCGIGNWNACDKQDGYTR